MEREPMQSVLERLIDKISTAEIDQQPSDNIYMEDVFTPATYADILSHLPADDDYHFIEHPDAILPNGKRTRKLLDLTAETIQRLNSFSQDFWQQMNDVFTSEQLVKAIVEKFQAKLKIRFGDQFPEMMCVPILYRDFAGYRITPHTDAPYKIATLQFYFPKDHTQLHLGTSFLKRNGDNFQLLKTNPFKPNSAYAFVRTDESWHSVREMAAYETKRDSLALTIYLKGQEYKSTAKTY